MSAEEKLRELVAAVERMRERQRAHRRAGSPSYLAAARRSEQAVDKIVRRERADAARESQPELTEGSA